MRPASVESCPRSSSALMETAVLEIAPASPSTSEAGTGQPSSCPAPKPTSVHAATCNSAPGTAICQTRRRSRGEKCSPMANIKSATPISASSARQFLIGDKSRRMRTDEDPREYIADDIREPHEPRQDAAHISNGEADDDGGDERGVVADHGNILTMAGLTHRAHSLFMSGAGALSQRYSRRA